MAKSGQVGQPATTSRRAPFIKLAIVLVIAVLVVIVVFQNTEPVQTEILFFTITLSRAILLLLTCLIGFVGGIISTLYLLRHRRSSGG